MYYVYKRRPSALSGGQLFYATFAINRFGLVSLQRVLKKLKTSISSIQSLDVTGNWDVSQEITVSSVVKRSLLESIEHKCEL